MTLVKQGHTPEQTVSVVEEHGVVVVVPAPQIEHTTGVVLDGAGKNAILHAAGLALKVATHGGSAA